MRTDAIDQAMAIALHPACNCETAVISAALILCLAQSLKAHPFLIRTELMEGMLEVCALRHKLVNEQSLQPQAPMAVKALQ